MILIVEIPERWHMPYLYTQLFGDLPLGVIPGQEFTAVIHAVSPLVSQSQPIMKLLQVVSKSKYCSQVSKANLCDEIRHN